MLKRIAAKCSHSLSQVYNSSVSEVVASVLEGYNGTVFAYGQTGTGKTYTMEGSKDESSKGIIPQSFAHIFEHVKEHSNEIRFLVRTHAVSFAYGWISAWDECC